MVMVSQTMKTRFLMTRQRLKTQTGTESVTTPTHSPLTLTKPPTSMVMRQETTKISMTTTTVTLTPHPLDLHFLMQALKLSVAQTLKGFGATLRTHRLHQ